MSSFKRLNKADVTTTLYAANKPWNVGYTKSSATPNINIYNYTGSNVAFTINGIKDYNQYRSLVYSTINHLFYQNYTSSLDTGSLMFNINTYESASQQRPTASYFNYNNNPLLIKQFPSGAGDTIGVVVINQDLYGSKILPNSFQISSSYTFTPSATFLGIGSLIKDDGYGNLYDISQAQSLPINLGYTTLDYFETGNLTGTGIFFVGNIFYSQGTVVITNPNYQGVPRVSSCLLYTLTPTGTATFNFIDCIGVNRSISISSAVEVCASSAPVVTTGTGAVVSTVSCNSTITTTFQNEHRIYENEVRCIVRESDFNLSYNPSLLKYGNQVIVPISGSPSNGYTTTGSFDNTTIKDFATGSVFQPYVTTIGLYNDDNELLMVAKLGKPIMLSPDTDMTFIVKYDT